MQTSTSFFYGASLAVLAALSSAGLAQAQTAPPAWSWANAVTSASATFLSGMTTDAAGNTYIAGSLQSDPVTVAPGTVLTSLAASDAYVAKYSASGSLLWTRQLTGSGNEKIERCVTDAAGNVYLTGWFSGSIQLGGLSLTPGTGVTVTFMASLDAQGQPRWLREVSRNGPSVQDVGVDAAGNLYLSGTFAGSNPNVAVGGIPLSAPGTISIFLAKFNSQGVVQWAQHGGGIPFTGSTISYFGHTLTVSPAGDAYLSWTIPATAGGFGTVPPAAGYGDDDVTLVRYNTQGVAQWQKRYGSASFDNAGTPALDGNGHLLVPMTFSSGGPATVDAQTLTGTGQRYGALLQLDAGTGNLQWVQRLESSTSVHFRAVAADAAGNSYVAGHFVGTAQTGSQPLSSSGGSSDVLVASYSAQGTPRWFQKSNSAQLEAATFIALSASNELSVGGTFTQQSQFGNTTLTSGGAAATSNAFVAHLSALPTATQAARPLALGFFPNPATHLVRVPSLPAGTPVQLLDALGRVARETRVSAASEVSVLGLAPGLYTLHATDKQGQQYAARVAVE
ncbi:T9SS type A sorting domain-containing protein [Hymenobacter monticola]|uniref:T9SS type A sorting domain-containing protein n=1 Tax=Hymenobacter monticola TaxID=1705399 RepID=A0ABY4B8V4_9BACT|nr:T9SS type A sorting domain-containing protein [Hymenobacter monticola]UOE35583.1 T9SS type A sorting domain-containing protein [Hymenobacter monticola]